MMDRELLSRTPVRVAMAALGLSVLLLLVTVVRVARGSSGEGIAPPMFDASAASISVPTRAPADISIAVTNDLFAPDRVEPDEAYSMPGDEKPTEQVVVAETPPPIVLGTAIMGEGRSFATCQLGDNHALIVRVGEKLGEFTVKSIERGKVAFTNAAGRRFEVTALKTGT